jgi:hypothetical protein
MDAGSFLGITDVTVLAFGIPLVLAMVAIEVLVSNLRLSPFNMVSRRMSKRTILLILLCLNGGKCGPISKRLELFGKHSVIFLAHPIGSRRTSVAIEKLMSLAHSRKRSNHY